MDVAADNDEDQDDDAHSDGGDAPTASRVSLVGIDAFRRRAPFSTVELPRPHHKKKQTKSVVDGRASNGRRGSTVQEIEKLVGTRGYFSLSADEFDEGDGVRVDLVTSSGPGDLHVGENVAQAMTTPMLAAESHVPPSDSGFEVHSGNSHMQNKSENSSASGVDISIPKTTAQRRRSTIQEIETVANQHDFFTEDDEADTPRASFISQEDSVARASIVTSNDVSIHDANIDIETRPTSAAAGGANEDTAHVSDDESDSSVSQDASTTTEEDEAVVPRTSVFRRASLAIFGK